MNCSHIPIDTIASWVAGLERVCPVPPIVSHRIGNISPPVCYFFDLLSLLLFFTLFLILRNTFLLFLFNFLDMIEWVASFERSDIDCRRVERNQVAMENY